MDLVASLLPKITKNEIQKGLDVSIKEASRFGITTILDAGTDTYPPNYSSENNYDGLSAYKGISNDNNLQFGLLHHNTLTQPFGGSTFQL